MSDIKDRLETAIKAGDGYWPMVLAEDALRHIETLTSENAALVSQLDAVGALPEKWREKEDSCVGYKTDEEVGHDINNGILPWPMTDCADELEALLK